MNYFEISRNFVSTYYQAVILDKINYFAKILYIGSKCYMKKRVTSASHHTFTAPELLTCTLNPGSHPLSSTPGQDELRLKEPTKLRRQAAMILDDQIPDDSMYHAKVEPDPKAEINRTPRLCFERGGRRTSKLEEKMHHHRRLRNTWADGREKKKIT